MATAPKQARGKAQGPVVELRLPGNTVVMACYVAARRAGRGEDCATWGGWQRVERAGGEAMNDRGGLHPEAWRSLP
jgi:hypothetical protein